MHARWNSILMWKCYYVQCGNIQISHLRAALCGALYKYNKKKKIEPAPAPEIINLGDIDTLK